MLIEHRVRHSMWFIMTINLSSRFLLLGVWLLLMAALVAAQSHQAAPPQAGASPITEAQALLAAGKTDAAIAAWRALPKPAADESQLSHVLGLAYYQKADYQRAIDYLSASVKQAREGTPQYRQAV